MKLVVPCNYQMHSKLFKHLENKPTDFVNGYVKDYKGYAMEEIDISSVDYSIVNLNGELEEVNSNFTNMGLIPITSFSSFKDLCHVKKIHDDGVLEVEFGAYPQNLMSNIRINNIQRTGKEFSIFVNNEIVSVEEFICAGLKFIQYDGKFYTVTPITWVVDVQKDLACPKSALVGGVPFCLEQEVQKEEEFNFDRPIKKNMVFKPEFIGTFLNYFLNDITTDLEKMKLQEIEERLEKEKVEKSQRELERSLRHAINTLRPGRFIYLNPVLNDKMNRLHQEMDSFLDDLSPIEAEYSVDSRVYRYGEIGKAFPDGDAWKSTLPDDLPDYKDESFDKMFKDDSFGELPFDKGAWEHNLPSEYPMPSGNVDMDLGKRIEWSKVYTPHIVDEYNLTDEEIELLKEWFDRDIYSLIEGLNIAEEDKLEFVRQIEESKDKYKELVREQTGGLSM